MSKSLQQIISEVLTQMLEELKIRQENKDYHNE